MSIYDHDNSQDESQTPASFQWPDLNDSRINVVAASAAQQPSPASLPSPHQNATPGSQPTPGGTSTPGHPSILDIISLSADSPACEKDFERSHTKGAAESHTRAKRRRLTFESSIRGSGSSDSPAQLSDPSPTWHTGWTPTDSMDSMTANTTTGSSDFDGSGYHHGLEPAVSQTLSRIYLNRPCWPLQVSAYGRDDSRVGTKSQQNGEEAKLLRHFVENLARNFDLTDPLNHFRSVVPQRAATCPTLMVSLLHGMKM